MRMSRSTLAQTWHTQRLTADDSDVGIVMWSLLLLRLNSTACDGDRKTVGQFDAAAVRARKPLGSHADCVPSLVAVLGSDLPTTGQFRRSVLRPIEKTTADQERPLADCGAAIPTLGDLRQANILGRTPHWAMNLKVRGVR